MKGVIKYQGEIEQDDNWKKVSTEFDDGKANGIPRINSFGWILLGKLVWSGLSFRTDH